MSVYVCDCIMGTGKAQPLDSMVLTETGFVRMGDIKPGVSVFGDDGELHEVIGVFPQGLKDVYRVRFSDGTTTECCGEHLWTYQLPQDKAKGVWRTDELSNIMSKPLYKETNRGDKNWQIFIPLTKPVQFKHRDVPIDPYVLGAILGDGHMGNGALAFYNSEQDVIDNIRLKLEPNYTLYECNDESRSRSFLIKNTDWAPGKNNINDNIRILKELGLYGKNASEKFIPNIYLNNSIGVRLSLLRGLIDTDGCSCDGDIVYYTTSKMLAENVTYIVQSIGGTAALTTKEKPYYVKNGERFECSDCYCLYIKVPDRTQICTSSKHMNNIRNHPKHTGVTRSIRDISFIGEKECQCILIDSSSHLYITDNFIVTHNTSASIAYMNEHKDQKYVFITPYLNEAARIKNGCPSLRFVEPSDKLKQYNFRKFEHTAALIREGRNITTTHQAFKRYTPDTLNDIKEQGYTLIIDENVDVLEAFDFHQDDLQLAIDAGYIEEHDGIYSIANEGYKGKALHELFSLLKSRELIRMTDKDDNSLFYWALPPELLTSFKDVFILTYLFKGQSLHHFVNIYDIPYEYIGIKRTEDGGYRFGEYPGHTPEYVAHLKDMLKILDAGKINDVGGDYYALSMSWFKKSPENTEQIKRNVSNCINNIWRDVPADRKLWGSYNGEANKIKGKGYTKSFLTFNAKATNAYRKRDCLVYIANLFMNVNEKKFYQMHGIEVDEDVYALSIMVQWIWRSAIRDGGEVSLYIPSSRMRTLLTDWIETTSKGGNTVNE